MTSAFLNRCPKITDVTTNSIATTLTNLTGLAELHLYLGRTKMTGKGMIELSNAISHLRHLTALTLIMASWNQITTEACSRLAFAFTSLLSLVKIWVSLSETGISDNGVVEISHKLRHLTSLSDITIVFEGNLTLTDEGCSTISDGLSCLIKPTVLNLSFWGCKNVGDKTIAGIGRLLLSYPMITKLELRFISSYE
eukprot:TRINITY_DN5871_c0_g3_i4.p1 TRINITY_DN5871_c0_g3~~TRINITY_DN5871_c0_g3_i4.p1  ORF type:complete len:196 (+),score=2.67 TRINITY_DN5871_c0_g3_i4:144-731(+)